MKGLAETVVNFYVDSTDFNGIPLGKLIDVHNEDELQRIRQLVGEGVLEIVSSAWDVNPHIKRQSCLPRESQISALRTDNTQLICVYPTASLLHRLSTLKTSSNNPFTKQLQLGEPQLKPMFFELAALERYYSDPRYEFVQHNFGGRITISTEYWESEETQARDKVVLESFGYGKNSKGNLVVVVFLRYLSRLTPEHQRHWEGHLSEEQCKINSEYAKSSIGGEWSDTISIYEAFLEEFLHINQICSLIGRSPLFRNTFQAARPRDFGPILRPTRGNCEQFIHLLDKMLSDNINRDFFLGTGLMLVDRFDKSDGTIESRPKGSIRLLEEWLRKNVRFPDREVINSLVAPMKWIHRLRHPRAHSIREDRFDFRYHKLQQRILIRAYRGLQGLRIVLSTHPSANHYVIPPHLANESIGLL